MRVAAANENIKREILVGTSRTMPPVQFELEGFVRVCLRESSWGSELWIPECCHEQAALQQHSSE